MRHKIQPAMTAAPLMPAQVRQSGPRLPGFMTAHPVITSWALALVSIQAAAMTAPSGGQWPLVRDHVVTNTATASFAALVLALYLARKMMVMPLVHALGYLVLSIVSAFWFVWWGVKIAGWTIANTQYFTVLFLFASAMTAMSLAMRRYAMPVYAVVPCSAKPLNSHLKAAQIRTLASPADEIEGCQGLIVDFSVPLGGEWERLLSESAMRGLQIIDVRQFNEAASGRANIADHGGHDFLGVLPALVYPQVKRALDVIAALLLLPPVCMIIGACAVLIRLDSGGPVFFRQERMGYRGRVFRVWKLRTMDHRPAAAGPSYTQAGDVRVTSVGRILRQYRLDELPQIFNILNGDMSWIGPRPEALSLSEWYAREIPFYVYRHVVRPGISGWAQVNQGNVAEVDAARRKLEYDFYYIKNVSILLDLIIVIKTIRTVLTGFGSR